MTRRYEAFTGLGPSGPPSREVRRIVEPSADPDAGEAVAASLPPALGLLAEGLRLSPKAEMVKNDSAADPFDREVALTYRTPSPGVVGAARRVRSPHAVQADGRHLHGVLKMLALQVASEYLHATDVRSPQVNQTLAGISGAR